MTVTTVEQEQNMETDSQTTQQQLLNNMSNSRMLSPTYTQSPQKCILWDY